MSPTARHAEHAEVDGARAPARAAAAAPRPATLQAAAGNRAVTSLLQRQESDAPTAATAGPAAVPNLIPTPEMLAAALGDLPALTALLRSAPPAPAAGLPWPQPPAGSGGVPEQEARPGTGGDLLTALAGVPTIDRALDSAKEKLAADWAGLPTGGKLLVAVTGATVAAPMLAKPDVRAMLDGVAVPKPALGSPWLDNLDVTLHTHGDGVGVGLRLDVAGLTRGLSGDKGPARTGSRTTPAAGVMAPPALLALDRLARARRPVAVPLPPVRPGRTRGRWW